jgi:hypothetical protein
LFGGGHSSTYTIKNIDKEFEIREVYVSKKDKTYYIEVSFEEELFNIQTNYNFFGSSRILKKIESIKTNDYNCILPIFYNDKIVVDIICKKDNVQYLYHQLKGKDQELDSFVLNLKEEEYTEQQFYDDKLEVKIIETMTAYVNNIAPNHFVTINNYKGIFTINEVNLQRMANVPLFTTDTYKRPLSALVSKYYITADYNQRYAFDKFKIVDITTNKTFDLFINGKIEHSSYVQGVIDNKLYILDTYNKKQYELRIDPFAIVEVGNEQTEVKQYDLGVWSRISMADAIKNKPIFNLYEKENDSDYFKVDKIGDDETGYYYYFEKVGSNYKVYRASQRNKELITYLFETKNIEDIVYIDDFIYFTDGKDVKYYNNYYGLRTLFSNSELVFNESLYYSVYKK